MKFFIILLLLFSNMVISFCQDTKYEIDTIVIKGNKRTKSYIIYNELDFKLKDSVSLSELEKIFGRNQSRLLGTSIFIAADFNISEINSNNKSIIIELTVTETWYLFPYFYFDLIDRNLSEWIYLHNASLKRVNLVVNLRHNNLSGNRDILELKLMTGISKKIELTYSRPFIKENNRLGLMFNILIKKSNEIAYNTLNNKLVFYKNFDHSIFYQNRFLTKLTYRPSIDILHSLDIAYFANKTDTIITNNLNPDFFDNKSKQNYFSIKYRFETDRRNYKIYPTKGFSAYTEIEKVGLFQLNDIDQLILWGGFEKYFNLTNKLYSSIIFDFKYSILDHDDSYFNNKALGYFDKFLNGYELYVVDGRHYAMLKTSQKYNFLKGNLNLNKIIKVNQFKSIPFDLFLTLNFDSGYVDNNINFADNNFNNRLLYGGGIGLDLILYHNLYRMSYSINHTGESGFYFHFKTIF